MGTTLQLRDLDTYGNFIHNQWITPFGGGSGFLNGNPGVVPFVEAVGLPMLPQLFRDFSGAFIGTMFPEGIADQSKAVTALYMEFLA